MRLLVATRSGGKRREIAALLGTVEGLELVFPEAVGLLPTPEEDRIEVFHTFEENAEAKAAWFLARTGLPTVADDSGLAVDALQGAPGVRSRRFAADAGWLGDEREDEANNRVLLRTLEGVPEARRRARFICVAALALPGQSTRTFRGEVEGRILPAAQGSGGFGYDPLFHVDGLGRTFAEAGLQEKEALSHRGQAFRALAAFLKTLNETPPHA
jgi:XTP/dITP diphosphohydrolase